MEFEVGQRVQIAGGYVDLLNVEPTAVICNIDESDPMFSYCLRLSDGRHVWFVEEDISPVGNSKVLPIITTRRVPRMILCRVGRGSPFLQPL